jgi:hypothetical protein
VNDKQEKCDLLIRLFPSMTDEQVMAIVLDAAARCTYSEFEAAAQKCYRSSPNGFLRPADLSNAIREQRRQRGTAQREERRLDIVRRQLGLDDSAPAEEVVLRHCRSLWVRARSRYVGRPNPDEASAGYRSSIRHDVLYALMEICVVGTPPESRIDMEQVERLADLAFDPDPAFFELAMSELRGGPVTSAGVAAAGAR